MLPILRETADFVTFTEEALSGKLYFLCFFVQGRFCSFDPQKFLLLLSMLRKSFPKTLGRIP